MNAAHIHLIFNHAPIFGFSFAVLVLAIGLIRSNEEWTRAALTITILTGLLTIPTYLSGEDAEEIIKSAPGFSEELATRHMQAAEYAIWAVEIVAAAAAIALYLSTSRRRAPRLLIIGILFAHLFALSVLAMTNNHGGKISHPEIRDGAAPAAK